MLLTIIFLILILTIFILFFSSSTNIIFLRSLGLVSSGLVLLLSVFIFINFDVNLSYFQEIVSFTIGSSFLNFNFSFGLDGISIFFFLLTTFLMFFCILFVWNETFLKEYLICENFFKKQFNKNIKIKQIVT